MLAFPRWTCRRRRCMCRWSSGRWGEAGLRHERAKRRRRHQPGQPAVCVTRLQGAGEGERGERQLVVPSFAQRFGYLAHLNSCLQSGRARYPLFPNPWRFHQTAEGRVQGCRSAAWCRQRCRLAYLGSGLAKCCLRAVNRDAPGARRIDTARLSINK